MFLGIAVAKKKKTFLCRCMWQHLAMPVFTLRFNTANEQTGKQLNVSKTFMDSTWCRQARVKESSIFYEWVVHCP
uniref:Uncharacterized protein n=1 Tax=Anguilla anguilla TaxID=7936 RepID=A0A0E9X8L7_ANGAN